MEENAAGSVRGSNFVPSIRNCANQLGALASFIRGGAGQSRLSLLADAPKIIDI